MLSTAEILPKRDEIKLYKGFDHYWYILDMFGLSNEISTSGVGGRSDQIWRLNGRQISPEGNTSILPSDITFQAPDGAYGEKGVYLSFFGTPTATFETVINVEVDVFKFDKLLFLGTLEKTYTFKCYDHFISLDFISKVFDEETKIVIINFKFDVIAPLQINCNLPDGWFFEFNELTGDFIITSGILQEGSTDFEIFIEYFDFTGGAGEFIYHFTETIPMTNPPDENPSDYSLGKTDHEFDQTRILEEIELPMFTYSDLILSSRPRAYWKCNDIDGAVIRDFSQYKSHLDLSDSKTYLSDETHDILTNEDYKRSLKIIPKSPQFPEGSHGSLLTRYSGDVHESGLKINIPRKLPYLTDNLVYLFEMFMDTDHEGIQNAIRGRKAHFTFFKITGFAWTWVNDPIKCCDNCPPQDRFYLLLLRNVRLTTINLEAPPLVENVWEVFKTLYVSENPCKGSGKEGSMAGLTGNVQFKLNIFKELKLGRLTQRWNTGNFALLMNPGFDDSVYREDLNHDFAYSGKSQNSWTGLEEWREPLISEMNHEIEFSKYIRKVSNISIFEYENYANQMVSFETDAMKTNYADMHYAINNVTMAVALRPYTERYNSNHKHYYCYDQKEIYYQDLIYFFDDFFLSGTKHERIIDISVASGIGTLTCKNINRFKGKNLFEDSFHPFRLGEWIDIQGNENPDYNQIVRITEILDPPNGEYQLKFKIIASDGTGVGGVVKQAPLYWDRDISKNHALVIQSKGLVTQEDIDNWVRSTSKSDLEFYRFSDPESASNGPGLPETMPTTEFYSGEFYTPLQTENTFLSDTGTFQIIDHYTMPFSGYSSYTDHIFDIPKNHFKIIKLIKTSSEYVAVLKAKSIRFTEQTAWNDISEWILWENFIKSHESVPGEPFNLFPQDDPVDAMFVECSIIARSADGVSWIKDATIPEAFKHSLGEVIKTSVIGSTNRGTITDFNITNPGVGYTWMTGLVIYDGIGSYSATVEFTLSNTRLTAVQIINQSGYNEGCAAKVVIFGDGVGAAVTPICGDSYIATQNVLSFNEFAYHDKRNGIYKMSQFGKDAFIIKFDSSLLEADVKSETMSDVNHPARFCWGNQGSNLITHDLFGNSNCYPNKLGSGIILCSNSVNNFDELTVRSFHLMNPSGFTEFNNPSGIDFLTGNVASFNGYYFCECSNGEMRSTADFVSWFNPFGLNAVGEFSDFKFTKHGIFMGVSKLYTLQSFHDTPTVEKRYFIINYGEHSRIRILHDGIIYFYFLSDSQHPELEEYRVYQLNPDDFVTRESVLDYGGLSNLLQSTQRRYLKWIGHDNLMISIIEDKNDFDDFYTFGDGRVIDKNRSFDWEYASEAGNYVEFNGISTTIDIFIGFPKIIFTDEVTKVKPISVSGSEPMTYSLHNAPASFSIDSATGEVTLDSSACVAGSDIEFTYRMTDNTGKFVEGAVKIAVSELSSTVPPVYHTVWSVTNLPPGIAFDESEMILSGVPDKGITNSIFKLEYFKDAELLHSVTTNVTFNVIENLNETSWSFFDPNQTFEIPQINFSCDISFREISDEIRVNFYSGDSVGFAETVTDEYQNYAGEISHVNLYISDYFSLSGLKFDQSEHSLINIRGSVDNNSILAILKSYNSVDGYADVTCVFESTDYRNWTQVTEIPADYHHANIIHDITETNFGWMVILKKNELSEYEENHKFIFYKKSGKWNRLNFFNITDCYPISIHYSNNITFVICEDIIEETRKCFYTNDGVSFTEISYPEGVFNFKGIFHNGFCWVLYSENQLFVSNNLLSWEVKYILPPIVSGAFRIRKIECINNKTYALIENTINAFVPPFYDSDGLYELTNLKLAGDIMITLKWAGVPINNFMNIENALFVVFNGELIQLDMNSFISCDKTQDKFISCKKCIRGIENSKYFYLKINDKSILMSEYRILISAKYNVNDWSSDFEQWDVFDSPNKKVLSIEVPNQTMIINRDYKFECKVAGVQFEVPNESVVFEAPNVISKTSEYGHLEISKNENNSYRLSYSGSSVNIFYNMKSTKMKIDSYHNPNETLIPPIGESTSVFSQNDRVDYFLTGDGLRFFMGVGFYHSSTSQHNTICFGHFKNFFDQTKKETILQGYSSSNFSGSLSNMMNDHWDWEILESGHFLCRPNVNSKSFNNQISDLEGSGLSINTQKSDGGIYIYPILTTNPVNR